VVFCTVAVNCFVCFARTLALVGEIETDTGVAAVTDTNTVFDVVPSGQLTITGTDFQDVFIEDLNPANLNEIIYNGKPEALKIVTEAFQIKGEAPRKVELKFSRHGPIFYVDEKNHKAFALRSVFSEPAVLISNRRNLPVRAPSFAGGTTKRSPKVVV
jgi:hypothetical protein